MHTLPQHHRILLLTEGHLGVYTSKTAASLLRYRAADVAGVVDSHAAGRVLAEFIPWAADVPILPDVPAAAQLQPDSLYIGVAPVGGQLPADMRRHVCEALAAGMDVVSGLHVFLADDAELRRIAENSGARIYDVRRPPAEKVIASARARHTRCRRVLTVGSDANVGKMVASLELTRLAQERGLDARFLATGQTGIMIGGKGVAVDACVADFAAGAIEQMVLDVADADLCFIEGQGSISHPGFSAVTLSLLHGSCPDALVLVHQAGRGRHRVPPFTPLPSLKQLIAAYERVADLVYHTRVVAVALNTLGLDDTQARRALDDIERDLSLPVADPLRHGTERLARGPGQSAESPGRRELSGRGAEPLLSAVLRACGL